MTWFDDAAREDAETTGGAGLPERGLPERQRSRAALVTWLVLGGVVVGLLVAGGASVVVRFAG